MSKMRCPACSSFNNKVLSSRGSGNGTRITRRRACECGERWATYEQTVDLKEQRRMRKLLEILDENAKE